MGRRPGLDGSASLESLRLRLHHLTQEDEDGFLTGAVVLASAGTSPEIEGLLGRSSEGVGCWPKSTLETRRVRSWIGGGDGEVGRDESWVVLDRSAPSRQRRTASIRGDPSLRVIYLLSTMSKLMRRGGEMQRILNTSPSQH